MANRRRTAGVLGSQIDAVSWDDALGRLQRWANAGESRVVCICNAHSVVTARGDEVLAAAIRDADMATPDGYPVAAMLRRLGHAGQERVNGPDLMWRYCQDATEDSASIYLYGGSPATLGALRARLEDMNPKLVIAGMHSPPFRELTTDEDEAVVEAINGSGAGIVWVSLGCPKQEKWMAAHRGRIHAVMVGVGAAFDYHAGTLARAPLWMQRHGLEWFHRLASEPKRLWRRYLVTNSLFLLHGAAQLCFDRKK